jgi:hypothetical protein
VIVGVVVRDPRLPALQGRYLFGDYCDGKLHSLTVTDGKAGAVSDLGLTLPTLDSFGVDGRGARLRDRHRRRRLPSRPRLGTVPGLGTVPAVEAA